MAASFNIDFGTPAAPSADTVSLEIDGIKVSVPAGTSIMRASALAGVRCAQIMRHRYAGTIWFVPPVPGGN